MRTKQHKSRKVCGNFIKPRVLQKEDKTKKTYDVFCGVSKKLLPVEHKSFQNGEVVTTTLKNEAKNQAKIKKVFWRVF